VELRPHPEKANCIRRVATQLQKTQVAKIRGQRGAKSGASHLSGMAQVISAKNVASSDSCQVNQGPSICQEWHKSFLQSMLRRWIRAITRMKMQDFKGQPPQRRAAPTPTRISDDRSHRRPQSLIPPSVLIGGHPRFHKNDNVLVPLRHRGGSWSHDHAPRGTAIRV
jgi:hypothetical protein